MPCPLYVITNGIGDGIGGWWGCLIFIKVRVGEDSGWVSSYTFFFYFSYVFCSLTFSVPLFKWPEHESCCLFVFSLSSLSLVPLTRSYYCRETAVSVASNYFKSQLPDHYSVDFLGKGRVFLFQSLFRVF